MESDSAKTSIWTSWKNFSIHQSRQNYLLNRIAIVDRPIIHDQKEFGVFRSRTPNPNRKSRLSSSLIVNVHIRHIMLYHFKKSHTAAEAFRDLNELFDEGTIGERQVRRWFERFKSGDISLEDEEGRGRPSNFDDQALLQPMEEDQSLTTRMLAEQFDVDQSTIVRRLKKLGKVWKLVGWVPHELSDDTIKESKEYYSEKRLRQNA